MPGLRIPRIMTALLLGALVIAACSDSTGSTTNPPPPAPTPLKFLAIATELTFQTTCGLAADSTLYCWGSNFYGELGTPTSESCSRPFGGSTPCSTTPLRVVGAPSFTTLSGGYGYFCALDPAGAPYCWGIIIVDVDQGEVLGTTPTPLPGGLTLSSIGTGGGHICGVTTGGEVACWGDYNGGVRGDPSVDLDTAQSNFTPNVVAGGLTLRSIASARRNSCALTTAGAAYCWGSAFMGDLGDPAAVTQTNCGLAYPPCTSTPVAAAGGVTFQSISAGWDHYCGLDGAGAIYCWGLGEHGELGVNPAGLPSCTQTGIGTAPCSTSPVAVPAPSGFARLVAGGMTTCGIDSLGAAACWGDNSYGQLGNGGGGGSPYSPIPTLIFREISPGAAHTCGLTVDSLAYCWGENGLGALGTGTQSDANTPVAVVGPASP